MCNVQTGPKTENTLKPIAMTTTRSITCMRRIFASLFLAFLLAVTANSLDLLQADFMKPATPVRTGLSGTKTIPGDYPSLTAAIIDIQTQGVNGPLLLELQAAYTSVGETFPLTFTNLTGASATNTITVRPASGATNLAITSGDATATVNLDNGSFVTFDGRAGGVGVAKDLTIENTITSGVALRFINGASSNAFRYVAFKSVHTFTTATIFFGGTANANGNSNNLIDNCDIGDGATMPVIAVYSNNTTQTNGNNTVSNCNIFNYYSNNTAGNGYGVRLDNLNTGWTITGNSFYQTTTRTADGFFVYGIFIFGGDGYTITNNFIGGSAASAGGAAWTTTGTAQAHRFVGIQLAVGTTTPSSLQGNTIKNFVWTSSTSIATLPGVWSGIYVQSGSANIGTTTGNTIGSGTGTGSISVTTAGVGATTFGIGASGDGFTRVISNNTIGSMTTNGSAASISASLVGIHVTGGTNTISGNTVGSTTTANSLNAATSSPSTIGQQVTGILSSGTSASITGNTVAYLNNNYAGTNAAGQIRGIVTSSGVNTITGNTVRDLSTTSANANATTSQSVFGIIQSSTAAGQTVSNNVVHSLSNTANTGGVQVTGIYYAGAASGVNTIARNLVHSLALPSGIISSQMNGMLFAAGTFTAQNNMVRAGLNASGASTAGVSTVRGIFDNGTTAGRNFYHNSVYLGGTQSFAISTFAFVSIGATNARTFQNNIFVNARARTSGTIRNYAVQYGGTGVNPAGLSSNGNIFFTSPGGVLGFYNAADRTTLGLWQAATGQDTSSAFVDPQFVNATGNSAAVDLHLLASNPAEGDGILTPGVTDDFDGETRSGLTPTDIGADAAGFTSSGDVFAPFVSYTALPNGSIANRTLTGFAIITDGGGVSGGANSPRLYFKKSSDADAFGGNTSADNGWKYVAATNAASPYNFTIDYSIINGGSVAVGDTIQYFVVAQDAANNFNSSPFGAGFSANPPVQNINLAPVSKSYNILGTLSSTKTVGALGDYPTLTGAGGFFAAINNSVVTGNLVINITGDLTEDGTNVLNQWTEEGAGNYTLTIQPSDGTMKTVSGAVAAGMIRLNGADRATIDGRFGGGGRFLTFRNSSTLNPTIYLFNDASSNTIRNCVIEGASTGNGVIILTTGATTGNDNNLITDNQIRDLNTAAGVPFSLIVSQGTSASVANSNNTISNNELFNFTSAGVLINPGSESLTISGNTIYQTAARTSALRGIDFNSNGTNTISQNTIRDLNTSNSVAGIRLSAAFNTTVSRNRIYSFPGASGSTAPLTGIEYNGSSGNSATLVNNQITIIPSFANNQNIFGIYDFGASGSTFNAYFNSVVIGGAGTVASSTWALFRINNSTSTLRNNIFFNNRTGTGDNFAVGNAVSGGSFSSNYNVFSGTGAIAANFMQTTGGAASFATWQTSTGGDVNSQASNPGIGDFTTAMFVDPTVGDLQIIPAGNPLVSNTGTNVAGITTDYDNDTRSGSTPDIGSDEFGPNNTAPSITAATGLSRQQGTAASNSTIATVSDNETAAGSLTVTATTVPAGINITSIVNTGGTVTADIGADCSAPIGDNTIMLQVSDGSLTATASLILNVAANTAPTIGTYADQTITAGGNVTVTPVAAPADNGSIASVTASALPGTFTGTVGVDLVTGEVSITGAGPAGIYTITVAVTDDCGAISQQAFTLTVESPAVTFTFNCGPGSSTWTNAARWTPSYPGTTINPGDTAILNCTGNNSVPITINGNLQLNFVGFVPGWTQGAPFTFNSGSVFTNNALWLSNGSTYTAHAGATITNNERLDIGGFTLESGATLNNNTPASTLLFGNGGTMTGNLTNGGGVIDIGTQSGDALTGNLDTGTTGTFRIQYISFFGPTAVGNLTVSGTAALGGTFDFTSNFPFGAPSVGNQFVVLDAAGGLTGTFTNSFVDFAPGLRANISYTATQAIITIGAQPGQTLVVTKTADADDGTCDADCSLREAINAANNTPAADTINLDIPTSDPGCNGGAGPCTILITIGQLQLAQSVTINGSIAPALSIIVDGNNVNRAFLVSNGTSFINNLTIAHTGVSGQPGGGVFVNGAATATLSGMLFRNNVTNGGNGAAAAVNLGGTLNIYNSTFSDNSAADGGAIFNGGGTLNLVNLTVTNNIATDGGGGGLTTGDQPTSIRNCIIDGNTVSEISGTFIDRGNNITSGDPLLGPLQDNGGPTFTRALLPNSPAIDAGSDCVFDDTCSPALGFPLTTDQRGAGFARKLDGNSEGTAIVDIGAFEAPFGTTPANSPPTITPATGLSVQQGSPAGTSTIATVGDDGGAGSVTVVVTSANPANGITITNIVNTGGVVTADIDADCTATDASFTLLASDGSLTADATLNVGVMSDTQPTLTYNNPASIVLGGSTTVNPTTGPSDNGTISSITVESHGTYTGTISVDAAGIVSISNAAPVGTHTMTIRVTDNCGLFTVAGFQLTVDAPPPLSGTRSVGPGGDFPSLTGAAGLFAAVNAGGLSGDLIANITGDLNEDGTNALNQWTESGVGNYTLTIGPDPLGTASMKTISGNVANGMIRFNGADRVTIDGRFAGAGRFLTFRNTDTSNQTFTLINDASGNTLRSSVIEGAATSKSVVFISTGTTTGNDNNLITDNQIRDRSDAAGMPSVLILSQASLAPFGVLNSGNTISNNELFNFDETAIMISETTQGKNESWTISGNTIYQTAAQTGFLTGIRFNSGEGTNRISGNTIRDLDSSSGALGISLSSTVNVTIERNRIYSFPSGDFLGGIEYFGSTNSSATVVNNQIAIIPTSAGDQEIFGISEGGGSNYQSNVYYNSVLIGGTANGTNSTWAYLRNTGTPSAHTSRNNIWFNNRTGGTGNHFAAGNQSADGTFSSNYNLFVGTGAATAAHFMDFGTSGSGTPVSFAGWQAGTGGDAHSHANAQGGSYTTAMFMNAAAGDLHIDTSSNPIVSNAGTPVAGIATDLDSDTRDAVTPDIGADEIVVAFVLNADGTIPPGSYDTLAVNNGATAALGGSVLVSNALTLNGLINTGNDTLTIGCNATVQLGSSANYVIGNVKKDFCSTGAFSYPVGTANGYSPVSTVVTALVQNPSALTLRAVEGLRPGMSSVHSARRYWTLTETGDLTVDLTFNYLNGDVQGSEASYKLVRWNGSVGMVPSFILDAANNRISASSISVFSDWAVGNIAPTAAGVSISGRVTLGDGRGLRNAGLILTDRFGKQRRVITSAFGFYRFDDVPSGETYVIAVSSRRFQFAPRVVTVSNDLTDINFVPIEN